MTIDSPIKLTDPNQDRYNAFHLISWWQPEVLESARVAVLGAGALGNEVLKNLALMGVGNILIADFDTIEKANLSRSVLYREKDEGRRKVDVAAEAVKDLNPNIKVQAFHGDIIHDLGLGILRRMDVIIGCVDGRAGRLAINRACWKINKPWLDGGMNGFYGEARIFWPGRGACYECTLYPEDYRLINERASCQGFAIQAYQEGRVPTTPTTSSIIGAIQAEQALKILHKREVTPGGVFCMNGLTNEAGWYSYSERPGCPSHIKSYDTIVDIPDASTNRTTLRGFMEIVHNKISSQALLELDFELVTGWSCKICGRSESFLSPLHRLTYEQSLCDGKERSKEWTYKLTGEEPYADRTLAELGIPNLEILRINNNGKYVYVELTGDIDFLRFE